MTGLAIHTFVTLFVVIDPIGVVPVFVALTPGSDAARRRTIAIRGTGLAAILLVAFALGGEPLLDALGVGLPAFRIAGGILLLLVAIDMVFARKSGADHPTSPEEKEARDREDISVFPLAFPLIGGPAAMTSVLLLAGEADGDPTLIGIVLAVLIGVLALTLATLLLAGNISRVLGVTGVNVIGRVLGVIMAALAVQFVIDGVLQAFFS